MFGIRYNASSIAISLCKANVTGEEVFNAIQQLITPRRSVSWSTTRKKKSTFRSCCISCVTYSIQWGWRRPAGTPSCRWAGWCALGIPISHACFCGRCLSPPCEARCRSYAASGSRHSRFWERKAGTQNTRTILFFDFFAKKRHDNTDKMTQKWSFISLVKIVCFCKPRILLKRFKFFIETLRSQCRVGTKRLVSELGKIMCVHFLGSFTMYGIINHIFPLQIVLYTKFCLGES